MTSFSHHLFVSPENQQAFLKRFGSAHQKIEAQNTPDNWIIGQCEWQAPENLLKIHHSFVWNKEEKLPKWEAPTLVFFSHSDKAKFAYLLREKNGARLPRADVLMDLLSFCGQSHADFITARTNFHPVTQQKTDSHNIVLWMTGMYNILQNSV
mgnify:CR=1 FL=1